MYHTDNSIRTIPSTNVHTIFYKAFSHLRAMGYKIGTRGS